MKHDQRVEEMEREFMRPGHMACPGCGEASTIRLVLKVLGEKTIVVILPSCVGVISATFPNSTFAVPCFHSAFEIAAPTAAGIANALKLQGREDVTALAFAGDGGTFDIGLQSLSGAADRNDNFIYVCLDNEAYMNTGIQSSSSTPQNAWTMTTPGGRKGRKKKFMQIIAAHRMPYAATASIGHPFDLMEKVRRAKEIKGTKFIHALTPCSTGWRMPEDLSVKAAQLAVETKLFPLYEVIDGSEYRITHQPQGLPVSEYLKIQGRFRHFTKDDTDRLQREVDEDWERLLAQAAMKGCV
ncbi:MAG: thiamine pyrophosphate-dependent enzyme [Syntrophorhabdales bacterium]|jgi:pyruvate ferredoxin oxidoreductase beta subunit/2-oxoisovalerate ferredoxin oxidoreductase beta subunit